MSGRTRLHARHQQSRDAAQMAGQLGRSFEAKAFLTLAIDNDPDRNDLWRDLDMLRERVETIEGTGRTLADLLAPELRDNKIISSRK